MNHKYITHVMLALAIVAMVQASARAVTITVTPSDFDSVTQAGADAGDGSLLNHTILPVDTNAFATFDVGTAIGGGTITSATLSWDYSVDGTAGSTVDLATFNTVLFPIDTTGFAANSFRSPGNGAGSSASAVHSTLHSSTTPVSVNVTGVISNSFGAQWKLNTAAVVSSATISLNGGVGVNPLQLSLDGVGGAFVGIQPASPVAGNWNLLDPGTPIAATGDPNDPHFGLPALQIAEEIPAGATMSYTLEITGDGIGTAPTAIAIDKNVLNSLGAGEDITGFTIDLQAQGQDIAQFDLANITDSSGTFSLNGGSTTSSLLFDSGVLGDGLASDFWLGLLLQDGNGDNEVTFQLTQTFLQPTVELVPEPATLAIWTMLGVGLGCYVIRRRRRK